MRPYRQTSGLLAGFTNGSVKPGAGGDMFAIAALGFLLGMQHALEADHIAAVSSIAARRKHIGDIVKHGLTWGLGHTLTLFTVAGAAILLGQALPENLARPIETAVGLMLVGLGAHVLWRLLGGPRAFFPRRPERGARPFLAPHPARGTPTPTPAPPTPSGVFP